MPTTPTAAALKASLDPYSPEDQQIIDDIVSEHDQYLKDQTEGKKQMAKSAALGMSAGGSLGSVLTGAGVSGMMTGVAAAPWVGAAGLALSLYEQKRQADAAEEQARIQAAENKKTATQNAVNNMINVARGLGV